MLKTKKGLSDAEVEAMVGRVEKLAEAQGLKPSVVLDNQVGSTALAQALAAWALEQARGRRGARGAGPDAGK